MNNIEEKNYIRNYQNNLFEESNYDAVLGPAVTKRKCLAQQVIASTNIGDENLTCNLMQHGLKDYSSIVDNQNTINNYASSIESLTSNLDTTDCLQWQNALEESEFSDLIESINCCKQELSSDDLNTLFIRSPQSIPEKQSDLPANVPNINKNITKQNSIFKLTSPEIVPPCKIVEDAPKNTLKYFKSARDELEAQNVKKFGNKNGNQNQQQAYNSGQKKSLGARRGIQSKFVPPIKSESSKNNEKDSQDSWEDDEVVDERLKNIDPRMVELIRSEIMDSSAPISWDDIAGLDFAKTIIKEVVVWPLLRPDIFTGLRRPPKGILLFGPPGTGKTLIGKCIASQSQSTFFSISASSLTSKWIGDGEKMVRAMFAVARCHQPAVIFIDEIDSLLSQRSETEHESSRRIKTEFLVQLDGAATGDEDRILVAGATNRPQELDEAARRRFVKRLYIPLPEKTARLEIVKRLMSNERNDLTEENMSEVAELSAGYSGADMKNLCAEASLGPIRSISISMIQDIRADEVRAITMEDFRAALIRVRASVSSSDLDQYLVWDKTYGAGGW